MHGCVLIARKRTFLYKFGNCAYTCTYKTQLAGAKWKLSCQVISFNDSIRIKIKTLSVSWSVMCQKTNQTRASAVYEELDSGNDISCVNGWWSVLMGFIKTM